MINLNVRTKYAEDDIRDVEVSPKANCPHCHGRGVIGINVKTKAKVVCRCVIKQLIKLKAKGPGK